MNRIETTRRQHKKSAHYEIRTRAGSPPADLESAALDRSAKDAFLDVLETQCVYHYSYDLGVYSKDRTLVVS